MTNVTGVVVVSQKVSKVGQSLKSGRLGGHLGRGDQESTERPDWGCNVTKVGIAGQRKDVMQRVQRSK